MQAPLSKSIYGNDNLDEYIGPIFELSLFFEPTTGKSDHREHSLLVASCLWQEAASDCGFNRPEAAIGERQKPAKRPISTIASSLT